MGTGDIFAFVVKHVRQNLNHFDLGEYLAMGVQTSIDRKVRFEIMKYFPRDHESTIEYHMKSMLVGGHYSSPRGETMYIFLADGLKIT